LDSTKKSLRGFIADLTDQVSPRSQAKSNGLVCSIETRFGVVAIIPSPVLEEVQSLRSSVSMGIVFAECFSMTFGLREDHLWRCKVFSNALMFNVDESV
jgi:hypothetical protein